MVSRYWSGAMSRSADLLRTRSRTMSRNPSSWPISSGSRVPQMVMARWPTFSARLQLHRVGVRRLPAHAGDQRRLGRDLLEAALAGVQHAARLDMADRAAFSCSEWLATDSGVQARSPIGSQITPSSRTVTIEAVRPLRRGAARRRIPASCRRTSAWRGRHLRADRGARRRARGRCCGRRGRSARPRPARGSRAPARIMPTMRSARSPCPRPAPARGRAGGSAPRARGARSCPCPAPNGSGPC